MKFLALLLLIGVANAARQIPIVNNPPPPGPTSGNVPGVVFSVIVPGKTAADWSSADSTYFCQGMVNLTSGYPSNLVECKVNAVTTSANFVAAAVGGQMYWADFAGSTTNDATARTNSRDRFVSAIALNRSLPSAIYAGANINDTCNSAFSAATYPAASAQLATAGMPLATCRIASNGYTETANSAAGTCSGSAGTFAVTSQSLCFTANVASTENTVGIDNGKVCAPGQAYITQGAPKAVSIFASGTRTISLATAAGGYQVVTAYSSGPSVWTSGALDNGKSGILLDGLVESDFTGFSGLASGCTAANLRDAINGAHIVDTYTVVTGTAGSVSFKIADTGCSPGTQTITTTATTLAATWSPSCDSDNTFYQKFNAKATALDFGNPCPACTSGSSQILFTYNGPNAGKFCSANSITGGVQVASRNAIQTPAALGAGIMGTSCIGVDVADLGAGNAQTGTPTLRQALPVGVSTTDIFPTPSGNPVGTFSSSAVLTYSATTSKSVAVDSEFLLPCSTPQMARTGALVGVAAGAGSCNTHSLWFNGGTGTGTGQNGIAPNTQTFANLPTTFYAPFFAPTPAPTPSPVTPSPKAPSPAKPPSPSPSPSPAPIVCTYSGNYHLKPLYAPCNNYYIASGTSSDCSNNYVNLRTKSQLGGKPARAVWKFATIAQDNLSTPTNVLATARTSCTNKYLAAPSDPSQGLKVGGSSWKWQFVPYPGSSKCDEVNMISQNRLGTTAFLQVPKTCDRFRYNATDGGRQRFRVTKV